MPELPDVLAYIDALRPRILGQPLEAIRISSPFVLRSVDPPPNALLGRPVIDIRRLGKRIVLCFPDELYLVVHLMIAGRFRWDRVGARAPGRIGLAAFDFPTGALLLTEASKKKRAALYVVRGAAGLERHDPAGLEVLDASEAAFIAVLRSEQHTLKRALTDPSLFSGIGNAYSDEILHAARLSPVKLTRSLSDSEALALYAATQQVLRRWMAVLRELFADHFPGAGEVTAFREGFAVHGRYRQPCPLCGTAVQRIRYAENETNYCPRCQTEGKLLADRALSRLLKDDWPRSIDELENRRRSAVPPGDEVAPRRPARRKAST